VPNEWEKIESLSEIIISCAVKISVNLGASHAIKKGRANDPAVKFWLIRFALHSAEYNDAFWWMINQLPPVLFPYRRKIINHGPVSRSNSRIISRYYKLPG